MTHAAMFCGRLEVTGLEVVRDPGIACARNLTCGLAPRRVGPIRFSLRKLELRYMESLLQLTMGGEAER